MPGRGNGFGLAEKGSTRRHRQSVGTPTLSPTPSASFTMTQFAAHEAKRIYQRATTTGGGGNKGQGAIRVTLSGATAGTVAARIRSDDGVTILQAEWSAGTIANGATFIDLTGIDARLGWFFVDLKGSDGNWQLGTVKVGMGALFGFAGQSLTARLFGRQDGQTATYASLGVTPDPNSAVIASYSETNAYMPTVASAPWITPGDVGNSNGPNAAGIGEFLNRMIALIGVNCGAFGHSQGGVQLFTFVAGQSNWTRLSDYIARIGGAFEGFVWGQGHSDSSYGQTPKGYASGLDLLFGQLTAANSFAGYGKYVWTIPAIRSPSWGTPYTYNRIRKGADDWCIANSAIAIAMYDIAQVDAIHESQAGSQQMGRHVARAMRAQYGASSGLGPKPLSAVRSGTTITLSLSNAGQTGLSLVGTPANRFFIFSKGRVDRHGTTNNRFPVSSVTVVNATTLSLLLANDPGDGHELDLWLYWPNGPADGTTDNIYDDITTGGFPTGRIVQANVAPIQIAAPTPGSAVNTPPGGYAAAVSPFTMTETSPSWAAGASGFGQEMTGGRSSISGPCFVPVTIEGFFICPAIPGSTIVLFGGFGAGGGWFVGINASGKIVAGSGSRVGATTLIPGERYHVAFQAGAGGQAIYLAKITGAGGVGLGGTGVRDSYSATPTTPSNVPPRGGSFNLRNMSGAFVMSGGALDEWAVFESERYTGGSYASPAVPYAETEADLVALYHCDGDARDAVAA